MNSRNYFFAVCLVTGLIFLVHLIRILSKWNAQVESFVVPMWFSWIALIVMGYLSYDSFRHWRKH